MPAPPATEATQPPAPVTSGELPPSAAPPAAVKQRVALLLPLSGANSALGNAMLDADTGSRVG